MNAPSFDDLLDAMSAAAAGDLDARVVVSGVADPAEPSTRLAVALNVLLDAVALRARDGERARGQDDRKVADEQRLRLAALVEASDDAIIGKTPEGIITSWNGGAERMFGFAAHEMIGRSILAIVPPGREDEESRVLARVSAGHVERFETVRVRKDGATLDVSVTTSPVRDAAGRIVAASKVARDISERRRADRALTQARDAAEAANRELRAFSYSVAHDLRAPLRGMNGFAQVLLDSYGDKLGADAQDWLGEILLNARKMGELIDGLLSLARLTREELTREPIDLSALAREVARDLASAETERSVDFEVDDGLQVEADVRLARALLENLLGNAWKFTRHAAAPRVELRAVNQGGARAFVVRDNGAGFDSAYAGKLFAPFQRLHTTAEFPGTGIGLATVERVVHRHGGRVWAEGSVGGGAAFYFTLSAEAGRGASS